MLFAKKLQENNLNIPSARPIMGRGNILPYVFVGDEAFSFSKSLLRPYGENHHSQIKKIFNYRLCRARRYI